ncbi:lytic polysaccharide monooxygenase auxiliary activity family 9 protein [Actinoallomurus sp. CA-150999]|uniref:lytic polysaccharide monooxygenase auxiliary activity family 9 protein n=1 Tax=Actinoallomurus sp. CA-150999 TaxID=3239887 RepID=UPI003D92CC4F
MRKRRKSALAAALGMVSILVMSVFTGPSAWAHGAFMQPGARTFLCWKDGLTSTGEIKPQNPACAAAVAQSGANSLYNWFAVLRSDGAGRTRGFVPDGQLCSGGNPNYSGFDLPNANWPVTHLTSGANFNFRYNKWAAHPGWFYLYVTKDGWDPTKPLTWDEMETDPFLVADHPADTGPTGSVDGYYYWSGNLPANKTGRHIIYSVWKRSDSNETFYGCSDVVFDGGNGEVTGVGDTSGGGGGTTVPCTATFKTISSWSGGYQAEVTVSNPGTTTLNGWTVSWIVPSGQTINSLWNGTLTMSGDLATVRNVDYNRNVAVGASTTFGLVANGTATTPSLTCTSP